MSNHLIFNAFRTKGNAKYFLDHPSEKEEVVNERIVRLVIMNI